MARRPPAAPAHRETASLAPEMRAGRRRCTRHLLAALGLMLLLGPASRSEESSSKPAPSAAPAETGWVCPPCDHDGHDEVYPDPGSCPICGMALVSTGSDGAKEGIAVAGPPIPTDMADRIDGYLAPLVENRDFSGVVLVGRGDEVVYERAFGFASFEPDISMRTGHRFEIASLSKTFTAAAVLRLAERGRLDLQDPLSRFLPELPGADRITIEHLLLHRSGLPEESSLPDYLARRSEPLSLQEVVARFVGRPLDFPPGSDGVYSNTGYVVLARVVELASGTPFATFLQDAVLGPLALRDSGIEPVLPPGPGKAQGYEPGPPPRRLLAATSLEYSHAIGAGAMYSTARDLHRWLHAVGSGAPEAAVGKAYPYGWGRRVYFGQSAIEQSGIVDGYLAEMVLLPDQELHLVYLSNIQSGVVFGHLKRGLVALALGEAPSPLRPSPPPATETPSAIPGSYRLAGPGEFSFERGPEGLHLTWRRFGSRAYLDPLGGDRFFVRKDGALLEIRRDGSGSPTAVVWNPGPDEAIAPRIDAR